MKRRRYLLLLIPLGLLILLWATLHSNWGLRLGLHLASAALPGELTVTDPRGTLLGPMQLRGLRYHDDQVNVAIQQLDLSWQGLHLLWGHLVITQLSLKGVGVDVHARSSAKSPSVKNIILPIAIEVRQAILDMLTIKTAPAAAPVTIDQIRLRGNAHAQTIAIQQFDITGYQTRAHIAGNINLRENFPLKLTIEFASQVNATHSLHGSGVLEGDLRNLRLSQKLSGLIDAKLQAAAKDILTNLHWQGKADVSRFNLHDVVAQAPSVAMQGTLRANGDLKAVRAQSQLHVDAKQIGRATLQVKADSNLVLSDYRFQADGDFTSVELPPAKLNMQGNGNYKQINITRLLIHALDGDIQGHARVTWQPQLLVNADVAVQQIHSGSLFKDWPGTFSGQLSLQSEPTAKHYPLQFTLRELNGDLRGYPLQGEVKGSWVDKSLMLDALQLNIGETNLTAHGKLAQQWDVIFRAHSPRLRELLPSLKGELDLNGRLSGTAAAPRLTLNGEAKQLVYEETQIEGVSVKLDLGLASRAAAQIDLQAINVQSRAGHWDTLQLRTTGTNAAHTITLDAANQAASWHTQLRGKFEPWRWSGTLDQFHFNHPPFGDWRLQQAVTLALAKNQFKLSRLCLVQDSAHLCMQGQWNHSRHEALLEGKALPLQVLAPWLPKNLQLTGALDMQADVHMTTRGTLQAKLAVHSPAKSIVLNFPEIKEQLILGESTLNAELNKQGLHAVLHLPLLAGGGIQGDASLPGWSAQHGLPRTQPLLVNLQLNQIPAEVVSRFIPQVASAKGYLQADMHMKGSLGQPRLRGVATWQQGSILVPVLGLTVHDIRADIKSARPNTLQYQVQARSGNGDVQLNGQTRLAPDRGWPTTMTLTSNNLEVSNIPQAHILLDSRLTLTAQGDVVNIDGDITVPTARLQPHTLPEGATPLSPDVIIIRKEQPATARLRWLVTTHLRMQLGDNVDFNGFGIRGKLRGKLLLTDAPGKLVMGQGEVSIIDGIYRMRGQDLTIRRGRLVFTNTFIDDPALDVEAVRTIETVTAGVRLKGTLKQPQLSVFSEPTMPESEVLAYLILGHSLSQSTQAEGQSVSKSAAALSFVAGDYLQKGIGGRLGLDELRVDVNQATQNTSLVMGKYLSPKLYLRYYSGIAESSRLVQLQYQLSKRVQIQTESGYQGTQSITGGDIFFTVEY